jgi:erythromycin esterase-like protein
MDSLHDARPDSVVVLIKPAALPLYDAPADYDRLLEWIGPARFVLIGEASHGTHEFYRRRAEVTRRLIEEKGFCAVAVEGDWPDAYRVNRYVHGVGDDRSADAALEDFKRFPTWMWRNTVVRDFLDWLRGYNCDLPDARACVGFYGLDLYSLYGSIEAVVSYLGKIDPEAARQARERYACFEHFGRDSQAYGYAAGLGGESCERAVVDQLLALRKQAAEYASRGGQLEEDEYFFAEQNARLAVNAEEYYRAMYRGRVSSWNLRDCHMAETLDALAAHLGKRVEQPRIVVWAHNSHLGDARATEMGSRGELNLGQLVRQRYADQAFLIGLTTYTGTVTAAHDWDEPGELRSIRPALPDSLEELLHRVGRRLPERRDFLLDLRPESSAARALADERLQRAIGVVYRPETERWSHYFQARVAQQFDALLHVDETRALEPLEAGRRWRGGEAPVTYPNDDMPVGGRVA